MRRFQRFLASLIFAAHALLGCGVHQACQHMAAETHVDDHVAGDQVAGEHEHHDCVAHECDSVPPCSHEHGPAGCHHEDCSYLKVDVSQVNVGADLFPLAAVFVSDDACQPQVAAGYFEPKVSADLSSTQLYVWHCALLI